MSKAASQVGASALAWSVLFLLMFSGLCAVARAGSLPDGRAYELVSPAAGKNGASVMTDSTRFRIAVDGSAVGYASLTPFGDVLGTGVATDYVSVRGLDSHPGTNGWATHAVTPRQDPMSVNAVLANVDPMYIGDYSADLSQGVFRAWSPVTDDPNVADTANLYLRHDLRTAGPGAYELLTECPACALTDTPLPALASSTGVPAYAGASSDFRHVVFESRVNLTSDVPAQSGPRTYEWSDGELRLVGQVPTGSDTSCGGGGPACVPALSLPGGGVGTAGVSNRPVNVISDDGSRIFFISPTNGSGGPNANARSGRLYVRTAGTTTDQLNASERTDCAGDPSCGGDGIPDPAPATYAPATYWGASSDGSRVFFTTSEPLTDDAPGGDVGLYMYDTTRPASDPHNVTYLNVDEEPGDISNDVRGVIGVSDDGRYVYFVTTGQLVSGEPLLTERGIFMWHDGEIAYVGRTSPAEAAELSLTNAAYQSSPTQARLTPDGRHLLLSTHDGSELSIGYDHGTCAGNGCRELYVYSADTQTLACASCRPDGEPATADAMTSFRASSGVAGTTWHLNRAISDDGRRVFFTTAEALLPADTNGKKDAYQYDVPTGELHLISSGTDPFDSYFADASPSGDDVLLITHERLVGWDVDESNDLYDARIGGGFPDPAPPPAKCSGAGCQDPSASAPGAPSVGSASLDGAGNLAGALRRHAKKKCKKGFVKRRVRGKRRCVKRKHRRSAASRAAVQRRSK